MKKCNQNKREGGLRCYWQPVVAVVMLLTVLVAVRVFIGVWAGVFLATAVLAVTLFLLFIGPRDE